jgi:glycosyltransferase involved in cell wall biosynthesis
VSVVVPSYRRPDSLRRCLDGIHAQSRTPDEVVVVRRSDDEATRSVLIEPRAARLVEVTVEKRGVLAAMLAGVRAARGEIVAFLDDDAVPRSDWLELILRHFEDQRVGAVGGRDVIHPYDAAATLTEEVGRVTNWGKLIGNHHIGKGPARQVMLLKGVNMAFRRNALALPRKLRGGGAQARYEVAVCGWTRKHGWNVIYDPGVVVDHYPAPRFDADRRGSPARNAVRDGAYNVVACLLSIERRLFWRRAAYGLLVGDRGSPGLARAAAALFRREPDVLRHLAPSLLGQAEALLDVARGRTVPMLVIEPNGGVGRRVATGRPIEPEGSAR